MLIFVSFVIGWGLVWRLSMDRLILISWSFVAMSLITRLGRRHWHFFLFALVIFGDLGRMFSLGLPVLLFLLFRLAGLLRIFLFLHFFFFSCNIIYDTCLSFDLAAHNFLIASC